MPWLRLRELPRLEVGPRFRPLIIAVEDANPGAGRRHDLEDQAPAADSLEVGRRVNVVDLERLDHGVLSTMLARLGAISLANLPLQEAVRIPAMPPCHSEIMPPCVPG
jgi:hypothetical protein